MSDVSPAASARLEHPLPAKRSAARFWIGVVLVAIVIFVLLPIVAIYGWRAAAMAQVDAKLAEIRARGEPTTMEELTAFHCGGVVEDKATRAWLAAINKVHDAAVQPEELPIPIVGTAETSLPAQGEPWPERAQVEEFLKGQEDVLTAVELALGTPGEVRFPIQFAGFDTPLRHLQPLQICQRLLATEALVAIQKGDGPTAARRIEQMYRLAHVASGEPMLVSFVHRMWLGVLAMQITVEAATAGVLTDEQLAEMQAKLREIDHDAALYRALCGERATAIFEHGRAATGQFNALVLGGYEYPRRLCHPWDLFKSLEICDALLAAAKVQGPARGAALRAYENHFDNWMAEPSAVDQVRYTISLLIAPTGSIVWRAEQADAACDLTDVILGLARFRARHQRLPQTLGELTPEFLPAVPTDVYDGQPIRYRLDADAAVVWCVGRNLLDDGGMELPDEEGNPDLVMRLRLSSPAAEATAQP